MLRPPGHALRQLDDHMSRLVPCFDMLVRCGNLGHGIAAIDDRSELSGLGQLFENKEIARPLACLSQACGRHPCFLAVALCRPEDVSVQRQRWHRCQIDPFWLERVFAA